MMRTIVRRSCGAALVATFALGATAAAVAADTGTKQLTKQQWIKAANRICSATDDKISALTPPSGDPTQDLTSAEFEEIAEYAEQALDYSKDALVDLKALKPPKKDAAKVKKIVTALKKGVDAIDDTVSAANDQDRAGTEAALRAASRYGDDFEAAAKAYGSSCGASDSTGAS